VLDIQRTAMPHNSAYSNSAFSCAFTFNDNITAMSYMAAKPNDLEHKDKRKPAESTQLLQERSSTGSQTRMH